ncbi:MAG: hypothetical protein HY266_05700 [Deltaproteobacteria bacterium]|nr:hypothetical protein [Deltaproteobacteria bacterium]
MEQKKSKRKICPFVQDADDNCYCVKMDSKSTMAMIYYCGGQFKKCEIFRKKTYPPTKSPGISL